MKSPRLVLTSEGKFITISSSTYLYQDSKISMKVISKQEAIEQGLKKFFTGKQCKNGHTSERHVHNGQCIQCKRDFDKSSPKAKKYREDYYEANQDRIRQKRRDNYASNREKEIQTAKEYQRKNRELVLAKKKQFREENRIRLNAECKEYYHTHKEQAAEFHRQYRENNKVLFREKGARYRAAKIQATVVWADRDAIYLIYEETERITRETGILHHCDHIVPLISDFVCGLHNEFNLQVLSASENASKGNRRWPDMPDTNDPELRFLVKQFKSS